MNAGIYKLIFSKRLNALVVVGENCSSQGKAPGTSRVLKRAARGVVQIVKILGMFSSGALLISSAWATPAPDALPTGGQVAQGSASISQSGTQMDINQASQRAIINWQSFDVGANAKVHIVQPNAAAALLNRVVTNKPSEIFGQIEANGQVVLVNANGIVFGQDGSASASSFTASTLDISDADFMAGNNRFNSNGSQGEVVNHGTIEAKDGGYVALLGAKVTNDGKIITHNGTVALGAADSIAIPMTSSGKIKMELSAGSINAAIENTQNGVIVTEGGDVYLQASAANNAMASIKDSGQIDTSGEQAGKAVLLADNGEIKVDGSIIANSSNEANKGGDIIIGRDTSSGVLATNTDITQAKLESRNGFVETSAQSLKFAGANVKTGLWLLDPTNVVIGTAEASTIATTVGTNGTSMTIETTTPSPFSGVTGDGNISINSDISIINNTINPATLKFIADNNILGYIGVSKITASGSSLVNLVMEAKGNSVTNTSNINGGIFLNDQVSVNGDVTLTGTNKTSLTANTQYGIRVANVSGRNINMIGHSTGAYGGLGTGTGSGIGVRITNGLTATGDIVLTGDSVTQQGVYVQGTITANNGAVSMTGTGQTSTVGLELYAASISAKNDITLNNGISNNGRGITLDNRISLISTDGNIGINAFTSYNALMAIQIGPTSSTVLKADNGNVKIQTNQSIINIGSSVGSTTNISAKNISIDNTGGVINATTGEITAGAGTSFHTVYGGLNIYSPLTATGNINLLGVSGGIQAGVNIFPTAASNPLTIQAAGNINITGKNTAAATVGSAGTADQAGIQIDGGSSANSAAYGAVTNILAGGKLTLDGSTVSGLRAVAMGGIGTSFSAAQKALGDGYTINLQSAGDLTINGKNDNKSALGGVLSAGAASTAGIHTNIFSVLNAKSTTGKIILTGSKSAGGYAANSGGAIALSGNVTFDSSLGTTLAGNADTGAGGQGVIIGRGSATNNTVQTIDVKKGDFTVLGSGQSGVSIGYYNPPSWSAAVVGPPAVAAAEISAQQLVGTKITANTVAGQNVSISGLGTTSYGIQAFGGALSNIADVTGTLIDAKGDVSLNGYVQSNTGTTAINLNSGAVNGANVFIAGSTLGTGSAVVLGGGTPVVVNQTNTLYNFQKNNKVPVTASNQVIIGGAQKSSSQTVVNGLSMDTAVATANAAATAVSGYALYLQNSNITAAQIQADGLTGSAISGCLNNSNLTTTAHNGSGILASYIKAKNTGSAGGSAAMLVAGISNLTAGTGTTLRVEGEATLVSAGFYAYTRGLRVDSADLNTLGDVTLKGSSSSSDGLLFISSSTKNNGGTLTLDGKTTVQGNVSGVTGVNLLSDIQATTANANVVVIGDATNRTTATEQESGVNLLSAITGAGGTLTVNGTTSSASASIGTLINSAMTGWGSIAITGTATKTNGVGVQINSSANIATSLLATDFANTNSLSIIGTTTATDSTNYAAGVKLAGSVTNNAKNGNTLISGIAGGSGAGIVETAVVSTTSGNTVISANINDSTLTAIDIAGTSTATTSLVSASGNVKIQTNKGAITITDAATNTTANTIKAVNVSIDNTGGVVDGTTGAITAGSGTSNSANSAAVSITSAGAKSINASGNVAVEGAGVGANYTGATGVNIGGAVSAATLTVEGKAIAKTSPDTFTTATSNKIQNYLSTDAVNPTALGTLLTGTIDSNPLASASLNGLAIDATNFIGIGTTNSALLSRAADGKTASYIYGFFDGARSKMVQIDFTVGANNVVTAVQSAAKFAPLLTSFGATDAGLLTLWNAATGNTVQTVGSAGYGLTNYGLNSQFQNGYAVKQSGVITTSGITNLKGVGGPNSLLATANINASGGLTVDIDNAGLISGAIGTSGAVTKNSLGTLTLTAANTYTGDTAINSGVIAVGQTGSLASGAYAGNIRLATNTTFQYSSNANQTLSGLISGGGAIQKDTNASTLTLTGANTYSGNTTIGAGTLEIGSGTNTGTLGTGARVTNNGILKFNRNNNIFVGQKITGTGSLIQAGTGTTTLIDSASLNGINDYAGTTTISAGSLQIGNSDASGTLGLGAVTLSNNANLKYLRSVDTSIANAISGTGNVYANITGAGNLSVDNAINLTGSSSANSIDLNANGNITLSQAISTSNTTNNAVKLVAGQALSAGDSSGGNVIVNGAGAITVGTGGVAELYTGSIAGTTGISGIAASGSGKFRYNSDEATTNYVKALGVKSGTNNGVNIIYREAPIIELTANSVTGLTYNGNTQMGIQAVTQSSGLLQNGDASALLMGSTNYAYSKNGLTSTPKNAGSYTITASGQSSDLGYAVVYKTGTLTIDQKEVVLTATKTYDGSKTLTGNQLAITTGVGTETLGYSSATINSQNVADNLSNYVDTVTLENGTGNASNYKFTAARSVNNQVTIDKANITLTGTRKYDGTTVFAGSNLSAIGVHDESFSVIGAGDVTNLLSKNVSANPIGTKLNTVTGLSVGISHNGGDSGNYNLLDATRSSVSLSKADAIVTANSATVNYSGGLQTVSGFAASGLVGGDTEKDLSGVSASRTEKEVGSYTTNATGTDSNYNLSFVPGHFLIKSVKPVVKPTDVLNPVQSSTPATSTSSSSGGGGKVAVAATPAPVVPVAPNQNDKTAKECSIENPNDCECKEALVPGIVFCLVSL